MSRELLFCYVLTLASLSRTESFEFAIARDLRNTESLPENLWSRVVITRRSPPEEHLSVRVETPLMFFGNLAQVKIFFANADKEILEVAMNEKIEGKLYSTPYRLAKTMEGPQTSHRPEGILGDFPSSWLPKNCSKVSAAILDKGGNCYNYYGINNYKISIPDLMVVEEYADYDSDD